MVPVKIESEMLRAAHFMERNLATKTYLNKNIRTEKTKYVCKRELRPGTGECCGRAANAPQARYKRVTSALQTRRKRATNVLWVVLMGDYGAFPAWSPEKRNVHPQT